MKTLKYAWRFLMRSKSYTIINLLGLAFSLACCIILMRYIHREMTVDTHCIDRDHVYGVVLDMDGNRYLGSIINLGDSTMIDQRCIEKQSSLIGLEKDHVTSETNRFSARVIATDSVFFQLFRYPVLHGSASLSSPRSALVTETFARKVFGAENPVGKVLRYSNGTNITVEGVLGMPSNKTFLQFDLVVSTALSNDWGPSPMTFYSFMPGTDVEMLNRIGNIPHYSPEKGNKRTYRFSFIPVRQFYWDSSISNERSPLCVTGTYSHLFILTGVCLLVLLTGILNFVNIYLVSMLRRGKEYGLKRVFGAQGRHLFLQIWLENVLLTSTALLTAWVLIEISTASVNNLFHSSFDYTAFDWQVSLAVLVLLPLLTSVYPFIKYNHASPVRSISSIGQGNRSVRARLVFLGTQYLLTFLLVVLAFYFDSQLNLLLHTSPGFRTKDIIIAHLVYESKDYGAYQSEKEMARRQNRIKAVDNALLACPDIEDWEASYVDILNGDYSGNFLNDKGEKVSLNMRFATPHFFALYDIPFVEGELPNLDEVGFWGVVVANRAALDALHYTSLQDAYVINEMSVNVGDHPAPQPIVAVVSDYYSGHLTQGKKPTIYFVNKRMSGDVYQIACMHGKKKEVLDFLRKTELQVYGTEDFDYRILEEDVYNLYSKDRQVATIYSAFAIVAIIIACLGLFGISLFDIRQRYREIAIRKVNGARLKDIYALLYRKYLFTLVISFVVAIPIAYYIINEYAKDFVVKSPIGIGIFFIAALIVSVVSMGTLFWQICKAANINPAQIMKTE